MFSFITIMRTTLNYHHCVIFNFVNQTIAIIAFVLTNQKKKYTLIQLYDTINLLELIQHIENNFNNM
ncbi:MAG: hypothetical protein R3Y54_11030 [Eubacteriales bacterium]